MCSSVTQSQDIIRAVIIIILYYIILQMSFFYLHFSIAAMP